MTNSAFSVAFNLLTAYLCWRVWRAAEISRIKRGRVELQDFRLSSWYYLNAYAKRRQSTED